MAIHLLASFPRSGNTLLRIILWHKFGIRTGSVYITEKWGPLTDVIGHTKASKTNYLKTHKPYERYLYEEGLGRHIYIERDIESVIESSYHYAHGTLTREQIRCGDTEFGSHANHIKSWRQADPLWLRFEELQTDETLQRLEAFTGCAIRDVEIPSFDQLHQLKPEFFRKGDK